MRYIVVLGALCALLALAGPAQAKEGVVARLRAPLPPDPLLGATIAVSWALVIPDDNDHPFNACGVFAQLTSASGGEPTRAYADEGSCRAHETGQYEVTVVVPAGGIGKIEIGLSGTADVFFPVADRTLANSRPADGPPESALTGSSGSTPPPSIALESAMSVAFAATLFAARRRTVPGHGEGSRVGS